MFACCEAKAQRKEKMAKVIRLRWLLHKRLTRWLEAARERLQAAAVQREAEKRREAERRAEEAAAKGLLPKSNDL